MIKMRGGKIPYENDENLNGHLVFMDSLVESAFNTSKNTEWNKKFSSRSMTEPTSFP